MYLDAKIVFPILLVIINYGYHLLSICDTQTRCSVHSSQQTHKAGRIISVLHKRKQGLGSEGWGCGAAIGDDPSEARLAVILDSEEGSHVDFWEKNLSTGNI